MLLISVLHYSFWRKFTYPLLFLSALLLFLWLMHTGFQVTKKAEKSFARNLAFGFTVLIMLQTTMNLLVVLGLVPTKGIGLPFISYGGSSLVIFLALVGVLLNIARNQQN